jgi:hypothetical protein
MGFVSLPLQNFSYSAAATTTPTQKFQPNLQTPTTHNIILSALEIITPNPKAQIPAYLKGSTTPPYPHLKLFRSTRSFSTPDLKTTDSANFHQI